MAYHPAPPLAVSESEAEALRAMARAGASEQRTALRAKVILRAADGIANVTTAAELGVSIPTVGLWRSRLRERGLAGLADGPRPGRPAIYGREIRERVLAATLTSPERPPTGALVTWPRPSGSARARSCGSGGKAASDCIGPRRSSSTGVPSWWRRRPTSSGSISSRPSGRSSCPSPRRPRSGRWIGRRPGSGADNPPAPARAGQVQRHPSPVCRPRDRHQHRHDPDGSPAPDRRVPRLPQPPPPDLSVPPDPPRPRQRVDTQDARDPTVVRPADAVPLPLHLDLGVLDEPGRDVVWDPQPPGDQPRKLRERPGPPRCHRALRPPMERRCLAVDGVKVLARAVCKTQATSGAGH